MMLRGRYVDLLQDLGDLLVGGGRQQVEDGGLVPHGNGL
jgi:hypothetical protein